MLECTCLDILCWSHSSTLIGLHYFQYRNEGHKPYIIPAGGFSALGSWGYIDSWQEMIEQVGYEIHWWPVMDKDVNMYKSVHLNYVSKVKLGNTKATVRNFLQALAHQNFSLHGCFLILIYK